MKTTFYRICTFLMAMAIGIMPLTTASFAYDTTDKGYIDFSSDRSTYFFRLEGGNNDKVFFDFFSPFDLTVKVKSYDPLIMYELENSYYFDENSVLMINIEDLKKLYAPYFNYKIKDNILNITHTVYDKLVTDGYGQRSTTIEYTKKVWNLKIDLQKSKMNSGIYNYTEYFPTVGGRNKGEVVYTDINKDKSTNNISFTFEEGQVDIKDKKYYLPISDVMKLMGKTSVKENGYLAIQHENLADVTINVERSEKVNDVVIPRSSNTWNPGTVEELDENYKWSDYMNDVADGKRSTGWLWRAFYIPSGSNFKDGNGNEITLEANRIVPFNVYVPTTYDKNETRLTYMLHGGTGNENTPTHRIIERDAAIDQIAEKYNYILVSPNGWTQNPIWRQNQALYSFEKSFEMVMNEFPVDENKVFITGNSLGGRGTLELAMRFPEIFKAFAASAPKIADKAKSVKGTVITIEETKYNLENIKDMPAMIIQGTADTTTSFKTQIGNNSALGSITKAIIPKLNNAAYITVEQGNHSYSYGSVLPAIFDLFESTIESSTEDKNFNTLNIQGNIKSVSLDNQEYKLNKSIKIEDNTVMISLSDLEHIYGEKFKVYSVNSYDSNIENAVKYYTIVYNNKSINFTLDETIYRKNMERYKEDTNTVKSGTDNDKDELDMAPQFSKAPYEKSGDVFVPAEEVLKALDLDININENSVNSKGVIILGIAVAISIAGLVILKEIKIRK
ncbi:alpha/beta hydrolase-fold protein [Clostridium butyricum]|uniref:alpha/beta hydrolase-fold protein n=1 Tax=Clostridium butyricum TaxID=1492 RepID=UPI003D3388A1